MENLLSFCDCISFHQLYEADIISTFLVTHSRRKFSRLAVSLQKKVGILTYLQNFIGSFGLLNMDRFNDLRGLHCDHLLLCRSIGSVKLSYFISILILVCFNWSHLARKLCTRQMFLHRYSWIFSLTVILMESDGDAWIRCIIPSLFWFGCPLQWSLNFLDDQLFFWFQFFLFGLFGYLKDTNFHPSILFFSIFWIIDDSCYQMEELRMNGSSRSPWTRLKSHPILSKKTDSNYQTEILQPQTGSSIVWL